MPYYDNPAGRLHELLTRLQGQNHKASLLSAWSAVLGVKEGDVVLHIGAVADLIRQIQEAVDGSGESVLLAPVERLRGVWARPIFPSQDAYNAPLANFLPGTEPLESLALVAAQLHVLAPEGTVPDDDELEALKQQIRVVVEAIREAVDLPDDVKQAIVGRLADVEKAIEHIHVGGPHAVRDAMDAVMGAMVRSAAAAPATGRSPSMQKVWATIAVLWVAFTAGDEIQKNIEAWPKVVQEITTGEVATPDDDNRSDHDTREPPGAVEKRNTTQ